MATSPDPPDSQDYFNSPEIQFPEFFEETLLILEETQVIAETLEIHETQPDSTFEIAETQIDSDSQAIEQIKQQFEQTQSPAAAPEDQEMLNKIHTVFAEYSFTDEVDEFKIPGSMQISTIKARICRAHPHPCRHPDLLQIFWMGHEISDHFEFQEIFGDRIDSTTTLHVHHGLGPLVIGNEIVEMYESGETSTAD